MNEKRLRLSAARLRPLVPLAAIVLVAIAAWVAWTGWLQMRDADRSRLLQQSRDLVAQATARALTQQQARMKERLALPAVQAALSAGDFAAASAAMRSEWPRLERIDFLPPDLADAYAGLPKSGFGKLDALYSKLNGLLGLNLGGNPFAGLMPGLGGAAGGGAAPASAGPVERFPEVYAA